MAPTERRLAYRIRDVMRLAGVSRNVVQRWIASGELGTIPETSRVVLIRARDVERKFELLEESEPVVGPSPEALRLVQEMLS